MNRRDAVQRISMLMGGIALSGPVVSGILGEKTHFGESVYATPQQEKLLAELADVIIPTTDTPGAKAAGAEQFIIRVMRDCTPLEEQKAFYASLDKFDSDSKAAYGKNFAAISNDQKVAMVKKLIETDKEFFKDMKRLTAIGYFTSEIGATKALEYIEAPGRLEACIPLKPGQKAWALG
ncbi:gluconate 2-dehydrogenase subunit 3 family protein [Persicitalea sp.]|uniref:gluconate 2-dehydrogenase subunit 3 family protein n=1 Tax=Persicitalea sp. TaxID=3100273 RepID=UPI0035941AE9